jgi:hypothetical protein
MQTTRHSSARRLVLRRIAEADLLFALSRIVPTIGAGFYFKRIFDVFQCILVYIGAGYSRQKASIMAGK